MSRLFFNIIFLLFASLAFGQQTVGLFLNDSTAYDGYTLFTPMSSTQETYLIDNCGNLINFWNNGDNQPGATVYLLENGNLLRTNNTASTFIGSGGVGGRIEIFNWEDELIWTYDYVDSTHVQHHDVAYLANGNILLLAWEKFSNEEVVMAGRDPNTTIGEIYGEHIIEIKPVGNQEAEIVWEWHLWDHLIQEFDSTKNNYGVVVDHPELLDFNFGVAVGNNRDWTHFNSINYNAELDQILLSSPYLNEIYIIDHSTTTAEAASHTGGNANRGGDLLYRWGNPLAYQHGTAEDQVFFGQHDARWIPTGHPDAGKIMVFNNGFNRPAGDYSTVDVIAPPFNNNIYTYLPNEAFAPEDVFWRYQADPPSDLFSSTVSGAQRLPNGNTLICEGREGVFREVTHDGILVWDYRIPLTFFGPVSQGETGPVSDVFRATRHGANYGAFEGRDLTPGAPIELNPLPSVCELFPELVANKNLKKLEGVSILENPFSQLLSIQNEMGQALDIEVFDTLGKSVTSTKSKETFIQLSATNWNSGFYFVRIFNTQKSHSYIKKIIKY